MPLVTPPRPSEAQTAAVTDEFFRWQAQRASLDREFSLHDGPPYANGELHIGHALNKVLKDVIVRYKALSGHRVRFVPGWDCHGLPIELKALEALRSKHKGAKASELPPSEIRSVARAFALEAKAVQRKQMRSWGVAWDPLREYETMAPAYEARQVQVFARMVERGLIFRSLKPVYWSPSSQTALAEAELEYEDNHVSPSVLVAFGVARSTPQLEALGVKPGGETSVAIWTTTPWTLPANQAICFSPLLPYVIVRLPGPRTLLVARARLDYVCELLGVPSDAARVEAEVEGAALAGLVCEHPLFPGKLSPLLPGEHVTSDSGSGLVHTAPGHGQEDFAVCQRHGIGVLCPVDAEGRFTSEVALPGLAGLAVLKEGNAAVMGLLERQGALLARSEFRHRYPCDWRTKKPVIFRATPQWFARVDSLKAEALAALGNVTMVPAEGLQRLEAFLGTRSEWCISRQRAWGLPIPVLYRRDSGEPLLSQALFAHVSSLFREHGSDCWWTLPTRELLPPELRDQADAFERGYDTLDVWFDSGSSWHCVAEDGAPFRPNDVVLEGSDQHRGWFQSSLLTSVAVQGAAPYRTVVTHGFVLDELGRKMSKSLGNVVRPEDVMAPLRARSQTLKGPDVLRLWAASTDYERDVTVGATVLAHVEDTLKRHRNVLRFMVSCLYDFRPELAVPYDAQLAVDRYMLGELAKLVAEVDAAYAAFNFARVVKAINQFGSADLSAFYFELAKDRLYADGADSPRRRSCQTTLHHLVRHLNVAMAPITPFTAFDVASHMPAPLRPPSPVALEWAPPPREWHDVALAAEWAELRAVRSLVNRAVEPLRASQAIKTALQAEVTLSSDSAALTASLHRNASELNDVFVCGSVTLAPWDAGALATEQSERTSTLSGEIPPSGARLRAQAQPTRASKCPRCWRFTSLHACGVCPRCREVVVGQGQLQLVEQLLRRDAS